jgi:alginate O-acetyltransferase complex protein AlgI
MMGPLALMPFNSLVFALFLPIVFALYWSMQRAPLHLQNLLLLAASYFFYGWWDIRFLPVIVFITLVGYTGGRAMTRTRARRRRRILLWLCLAAHLGVLGYFKYCNFFIESAARLLGWLGLHPGLHTLGIILPVGISFYTFQTLGYVMDVYRGDLRPCRDPILFFTFVSFFPQIAAGPIGRGRSLLPQFASRRSFDPEIAGDGMREILGGLLKKIVIADNLEPLVRGIFSNYLHRDGPSLLVGVFFFAVQIYCDFSGYTDIAIGTARLFGFSLARNFRYPFFSRDIAEFWRRWHISLSTWFRDYLYVPLCGVKPTRARRALSILIVFSVCGLWHGASWTFIVWGFIHGVYFLPLTLRRSARHLGTAAEGRLFPSLRESGAIAATFGATLFAWVFFRSRSIGQALGYLCMMVSVPPDGRNYGLLVPMLGACLALLAIEWLQRNRAHVLEIGFLPRTARWAIYYAAILVLFVFGNFGSHAFIYSQF